MCEWKEYKLGQVAEFLNGRAYKEREFKLSGTPIVRIQNLTGKGKTVYSDLELPENKYINEGDLIYAWSATFGPYIWKGSKSIYHYHIWKILCKDDVVSKHYLYYHLLNVSDKLKEEGNGTLFVHITKGLMESFEILLPPLPEQRAIASVLSSLDDKIDLLHRQNKTLEAMAETLFRQWFVEEADEGWEEKTITELFEIRDGTHDSPKQKEIGKPLLTSKHILKNRLDIENAYLISEDDFENVNRRSKVDTKDILFSMIGTIGLIYLEQSSEINYAIKNIGLFKTSQNSDWAYYTFLWLKSSFGQDFIHKHRSGSTQEYISLGSLRSIIFRCPPTELHREFNEIVNSYFNKININSYQIHTLEKLRDTLLPKLMSGEVKIEYDDN